jgi:hypothetical protein
MAIILAEGMRIQDVRWGLDAKPGAVLQEHKLYFNFDNRRYSGSFSDEEIEQCAESAPDKERVRAAVSKRLLGELQKCLKG